MYFYGFFRIELLPHLVSNGHTVEVKLPLNTSSILSFFFFLWVSLHNLPFLSGLTIHLRFLPPKLLPHISLYHMIYIANSSLIWMPSSLNDRVENIGKFIAPILLYFYRIPTYLSCRKWNVFFPIYTPSHIIIILFTSILRIIIKIICNCTYEYQIWAPAA